jgi:hypothetical protein
MFREHDVIPGKSAETEKGLQFFFEMQIPFDRELAAQ